MLRCGFGWVMYHLLGLLVLLSLFRIIDTDHAEPRPHRLRGSRKRGYGGGGVGKAQLKRARNARDHGLEALRVAAEEGRLAAERQQAALEIMHAAEFRARHALWPPGAGGEPMPAAAEALSRVAPSVVALQRRQHIVFSTGCEKRHDWESAGLFFTARKVAPFANITRLVSCDIARHEASDWGENGPSEHEWRKALDAVGGVGQRSVQGKSAENGIGMVASATADATPPSAADAAAAFLAAARVRAIAAEAAAEQMFSDPRSRSVGQSYLMPLPLSGRRRTHPARRHEPHMRAAAIARWIRDSASAPTAEVILILEPDTVLLRPLDLTAREQSADRLRGHPVAAYSGREDECWHMWQQLRAAASATPAWECPRCLKALGHVPRNKLHYALGASAPYAVHRDDLRQLAPRWKYYVSVLRQHAGSWPSASADRCGWGLAVEEQGLKQQLRTDWAITDGCKFGKCGAHTVEPDPSYPESAWNSPALGWDGNEQAWRHRPPFALHYVRPRYQVCVLATAPTRHAIHVAFLLLFWWS